MTSSLFWQQVHTRVNENRRLAHNHLPAQFASLLSWLGLRFPLIGGFITLPVALWLWFTYYPTIIQAVRIIIWR